MKAGLAEGFLGGRCRSEGCVFKSRRGHHFGGEVSMLCACGHPPHIVCLVHFRIFHCTAVLHYLCSAQRAVSSLQLTSLATLSICCGKQGLPVVTWLPQILNNVSHYQIS
jgi:hypothetical protein